MSKRDGKRKRFTHLTERLPVLELSLVRMSWLQATSCSD